MLFIQFNKHVTNTRPFVGSYAAQLHSTSQYDCDIGDFILICWLQPLLLTKLRNTNQQRDKKLYLRLLLVYGCIFAASCSTEIFIDERAHQERQSISRCNCFIVQCSEKTVPSFYVL